MRFLGLDIGDRWTGIAISDPSGTVCKPLKTVQTDALEVFLTDFLGNNSVSQIVYGLPLNQFGQPGEQAKKTVLIVELLKQITTKKEFDQLEFIAWDERRSSKLALNSMRNSGQNPKTAKTAEHAIAAAFILQNYMDFKKLEQSF
jgi:putative Holliday junction resolvase